jgi:hypothetical protein
MMELAGLVCLCGAAPIAALVITSYLMRKGLDLAFGCLGNGFVLVIAGILLALYITLAEIDICQVWLIGEPLCSFMNNF